MKHTQQAHVLIRTSAMGDVFVGRCALCGKEGLSMRQAYEPCPNVAAVTQERALLLALEGDEP